MEIVTTIPAAPLTVNEALIQDIQFAILQLEDAQTPDQILLAMANLANPAWFKALIDERKQLKFTNHLLRTGMAALRSQEPGDLTQPIEPMS